jgi:phosphatidate cytidylyltransferase
MSSELSKRVLTGSVGAALILVLLIKGNWLVVFLLVTGLSLGLLQEYIQMTFSLRDRQEKKYGLLAVAWVAACLDLLVPRTEYVLLVFSFLALFGYFLATAKRHQGAMLSRHFQELAFSIFGLLYLVFLPFYFRRIYELPHGLEWILVFLLINWVGDTGAYFAGKKYGRIKLYPQISPKKTREGAWGGLIAGAVAVVVFKFAFFQSLSLFAALFLSLFVGAVAQVGDLCESFLKRSFQLKDSGDLLPGHGGLLDRFDGVVFSLPVMYAGIRIFI